MSIRSRVTTVALAVGAVASMGLVAPTAIATAAPTQVAAQTKYFNIHIRTTESVNRRGCHDWSTRGNTRTCSGTYDPGHSAGFNNVSGNIAFSGDDPSKLRLTTVTGAAVAGNVNGRGGGDFTITEFTAPQFGTLVGGGQKLRVNVEVKDGPFLSGDVYTDFYLSGNLTVEPPATVGGTGPLGGLGALFGS